jgi:DNA-binding LytR/AlgR family response regulator
MSKRIYVVEDMAITRAAIINLLEQNGYDVVGSSASAENAWEELQVTVVDLIMVDINLAGEKTGLWLAAKIKHELGKPIIFLTAYDDDATISEIAKLSPAYYIRKPFQSDVLLINIKLSLATFSASEEQDTLVVLDGTKKVSFVIKDILYFKASGNYVEIISEKTRFLVRETLSNIGNNLDERTFVRIQRSFIINLENITNLKQKSVWINNNEFQISPLYMEELIQKWERFKK